SLDGYIQDRLNNPIHLPSHGTIQALRLEAPAADLVRRVVEARLRPALEQLPDFADLPPCFPFTDEQITRVAQTEPTLRERLQQFRHLFDRVTFDSEGRGARGEGAGLDDEPRDIDRVTSIGPRGEVRGALANDDVASGYTVKSVAVVEVPASDPTSAL